ncbi:MAG TPA: hypothetical protein VGF48_14590 [Thermoanaerobaculia bacterium]|jgi:hypothetical protein
MSAVVIALIAILVVAAFVGGWFLARRQRAEEEDQIRVVRTQATMRDWQLDADGFEYRYSGRTEGIPWTFHTARARGQTRPAKAQPLVKPARWLTTAVKWEEGAIVIVPARGGSLQIPVNLPPGVIQVALRPLLGALGGSPDDAAVLARAQPLAEAQYPDTPALGAFALRSTDPQRLRAFLENGAAEALASADPWLNDPDSALRMVTIVLWHRGLQVVTATATNNPEQIARLARVRGAAGGGGALSSCARFTATAVQKVVLQSFRGPSQTIRGAPSCANSSRCSCSSCCSRPSLHSPGSDSATFDRKVVQELQALDPAVVPIAPTARRRCPVAMPHSKPACRPVPGIVLVTQIEFWATSRDRAPYSN